MNENPKNTEVNAFNQLGCSVRDALIEYLSDFTGKLEGKKVPDPLKLRNSLVSLYWKHDNLTDRVGHPIKDELRKNLRSSTIDIGTSDISGVSDTLRSFMEGYRAIRDAEIASFDHKRIIYSGVLLTAMHKKTLEYQKEPRPHA